MSSRRCQGCSSSYRKAASGLVEEGYPGSLVVVGVVDEEGMNAGVENIIQDGLDHGEERARLHRSARLFQAYEKMFWDAMEVAVVRLL